MTIQDQPEIRRSILTYLKQNRTASIAELSAHLSVTYEAVRQQIVQMEREGWISGRLQRRESKGAGRPVSRYSLTTAGDHLFPKQYDLLAVELIETVGEQIGREALRGVLSALTEARVREWMPRMDGRSLAERIELLKNFYLEEDPYMEVDSADGVLRLVERNCPFLNVASHHPTLCSVTVSTLARLLGVKVVREERFQSGDRRCVFRLMTDQPVDSASFNFEFESAV